MLLGSGLVERIKHKLKPNLQRFGQEVESTPGKVEVEQTWTDDDIVTHLRWVGRSNILDVRSNILIFC